MSVSEAGKHVQEEHAAALAGQVVVPRSALAGVSLAAIAIVAALVMIVVWQQHPSFSRLRVGGPFQAHDADGHSISEADLRGKPSALYFGFTSCPDLCPVTLARLGDALKTMGRDADALNVLFVSVDPERDTPDRLREYLSSFDEHIRGVTGTPAQIAAMADAFHIRFKRVPIAGGYTIDHSANVLLLDRSLRPVGEIAFDEEADSALAKLRTLTAPEACRPGQPARVDLWSGAVLAASCSPP